MNQQQFQPDQQFKPQVTEFVDQVTQDYIYAKAIAWDFGDPDDPQAHVALEPGGHGRAITVTIALDLEGGLIIVAGDNYLDLTEVNWYAYLWLNAEQYIHDQIADVGEKVVNG